MQRMAGTGPRPTGMEALGRHGATRWWTSMAGVGGDGNEDGLGVSEGEGDGGARSAAADGLVAAGAVAPSSNGEAELT